MKPSMTLREIAGQLNRDPSGVMERARKLELPHHTRPVMSSHDLLFKAEHAATLLASYPPPPAEDWLTSAQAARILGFEKVGSFQARRARGSLKVEKRELTGPGIKGRQSRYNPLDVAREAARRGIRPRQTPRGTLTPGQFKALLGCTYGTLHRLAEEGCPHGILTSGFRYWRLAEVLGWLEGQTHPKRRRYAEILRLHLAQQRAA